MERTHPVTAALYFLSVILITAIIQSPVYSAAALVCSGVFAFMLSGKTAAKTLAVMLPMIILAVGINLIFSNKGVTEIAKLPSGNSITLETLTFSLFTGAMTISLVMWFIGLNKCMTSDKTVHIFGKILPSFALLLSMTLRTVPMFARRAKQTAAAQRFVGNDIYSGKLSKRVKSGVHVLSIAVTDTLEHSAYTARSMKYRGYGTAKRTAYSIFRFTVADFAITAVTIICTAAVIILFASGKASYLYYPEFVMPMTVYDIMADIFWILLCIVPTAVELYTGFKRRDRNETL